ncbi:MAG: coproporphyrinogen dehydrogenase HemZ [Clostridiales bacterium]|jgi:coproporphyrinogen dehydrogenase HemZ|nr:coproporphyrinogen dehydrogenase HemZ [Clostridiales bacterium]
MIRIILSDRAYVNDVHPIVKAFYPEKEIEMLDFFENQNRISKDSKDIDDTSETTVSRIRMSFDTGRIDIEITDNSGKCYSSYINTPDPVGEKSAYKNTMKRELYRMLSDISGKILPWGILTGIRPTKIVYEMLENGVDEENIYKVMEQEYLCYKEKISTSITIARREIEILRELDYINGYSLYVGIPFCPSTCLYCSFTSFSVERYAGMINSYLEALEKEIRYGSTCFTDKKLTTVYLGGGTPTTLSANQLDRLLGLIRSLYDFTYVREFCVEAGRPDSITREKLTVLKKWGVNRISINPQTMQQRTLDLIGRGHTVSQIYEAFDMARSVGHDNINMDIIIGLPGESPEDITDTLEKIGMLNPESLTVHTLAIKRAARLNTEKENYKGLRAENVTGMLKVSEEFAKKHDYFPYYLYRQKNMADNLENIGYARHGKEGLYNILIMEEKQTILALGAGATSKFVFHNENKIERVDNVKSLKDYISRIDEMIMRKKNFIS